ncbi:hypothetical protein SCHPADRAFT_899438 [Schizopora paradoxa]|uniref:Uncharacterized protein n=1 Tax=Schizopora paradoxa TaxID=27342 RepID=A0A0H2SAV3_9AGAM|nr:hypothetical protein SCHPADRAFT_899438 [Schizopora paradoxa]
MSLYTPVFPHTQPPPPESPSSSGSTSNNLNGGRLSAASYSSRLSELHLALATLPAEICPSSRESSPTSRSRSQALQLEIEDAVSKGRYTGDLCKTRYSRRGIASMYTGLVAKGGATTEMGGVLDVLPDTEEEWFEWERKMAESRSGRTRRNQSEKTPSADVPSKTPLREKVMVWQAGVKGTKPEIAAESRQPQAAPPKRTRSETATLGFPVVKRATILKEGKGKRPSASFSQPLSGTDNSHRLENQAASERHTDQVATSTPEIPTKEIHHDQPVTAENRSSPRTVNLSQMPPPSFPTDLPSSTPRNTLKESRRERDDASLNIDPSLHEMEDGAPAQVNEEKSNAQRNPVQQVISTPPSPPASNYSTPIRRQPKDSRPFNMPVVASAPNERTGRPLTPQSVESEPLAHIQVHVPRTPDRSPLKKHRTDSHVNISRPDGPSTPKSVINGLSRKRTAPSYRTPENVVFVDLAASKRSLPRPKPPRQLAIQNFPATVKPVNMGEEDTELSDTSPAKSERSYFSSPGSGSSEPSPAMTRYGANLLDSSPLAQFSQSPTRFAPMAASTQISMQGRLGDLTSSPTNAISRTASKQSIPRGSSGVFAMPFNSQYDVNGNIDRVSHLLEKDVDFGAWIKDADDADEEQVKHMTCTQEDMDASF